MEMTIKHIDGMKLVADIGPADSGTSRHQIVTDQPVNAGGQDEGPTPPELFVSSLATCVGVYTIFYCQRHKINYQGFTVKTQWAKAENPVRVGSVSMQISLPDGCPAEHKDKLHAFVEKCLVHNSLRISPEIEIKI
ncbi:MAG: OsmC family protein [Planctomycetota bacterium]